MEKIKHLIIPLQRSQIGFSALIKTVPFELWSLAGRPLIEYLIDEAIQSEIEEITFVGSNKEKSIFRYFNIDHKVEETLQLQNNQLREIFNLFHQKYQGIKFNFVSSDKILSNAAALLQAKNLIKEKTFTIATAENLTLGKISPLQQLIKIFHASEHPIVGLKRISADKVASGEAIVKVEKIAQKVYKLQELNLKEKDLVEEEIFVLAGRCVLTNQVLEFAKEARKEIEHGENLTIKMVLKTMLQAGKSVYGYEIKGESFNLSSLRNWQRAEVFIALNNLGYEKEWQKYFSNND